MCGQMDGRPIHAEMELARGTFQALGWPGQSEQPATLRSRHQVDRTSSRCSTCCSCTWSCSGCSRGSVLQTGPGPVQPWFAQALNAALGRSMSSNYLGCSATRRSLAEPSSGGDLRHQPQWSP